MSRRRFTQSVWCWWAIIALCCTPRLSVGDGSGDGLGKPDAQPNRLSGQVIQTDGQPAGGALILIRGHGQSGIDTHITTDDQGYFELVVRYPTAGLGQLRVVATSQDGQQTAFHRFAWEESQRVTEGFKIQLESHRTVAVEVVDQQGVPVEGAQVAFQFGWPHILTGIVTDATGIATARLPDSERVEAVVAWKDQAGLDYQLYSLPRNQVADVKAVPPEFPRDQPEHLVLDGARPLVVQFVDADGGPLENVSIYPWLMNKPNAPDGLNLSYVAASVSQVTDGHGKATFAWLPKWQQQIITLWPDLEGYERIRVNYDPATDQQPLRVTLNRLVPIRGQVIDADGMPVSGIEFKAQGRGRSHNQFQNTSRTDANGRYEMDLAPHQIYLLTVSSDQWAAAPQTGFAVYPDTPLENRNFQLRLPTRVHGRLINERTQEPIPNERVIVYQYGTGLHEMPDVELPNPENERWVVQPIVQYYATTNELGQFEFLLGDGSFDLRPPQQEKVEKFKIANQAEIEMDITTKIQPEVELVGLVVNKKSAEPVAGAMVYGVPRTHSGRDWQAETREDGKFQVRRREEATFVHAHNSDRSLAAIVEVGDAKKTFVIQLEPVGSVRGRLVDDAGEPVVGQKLQYGVDVPDIDNRTWSNRFGGTIVTDTRGDFELSGLAPGREYKAYFPPTPEGSILQLTKFTIAAGEHRELGDLKMPVPRKPYKPPTLQERIKSSFEVTGSPIERQGRGLETIKLVNQHQLIVFGIPDDPSIVSLMKLRFEDPDFRAFSDEFRFLAIPTDDSRLDAARALAEKLEEALPEDGPVFRLIICNATGTKVASAGVEQLSSQGKFSKDKFFDLLRQHLTEPLDARQLLDDALRRAAQENKRVIVQETATWCGPCHMLSRLLDANRVWEQDYIWVKMDHRWTGAKEIMAEIRDGAEGGIPWFAILDSAGKKLATSNSLEGGDNIGYPAEASGQVHFAHMLNTTRQRMSEADVQSMIDTIDDK